jgi:hypothetical protein
VSIRSKIVKCIGRAPSEIQKIYNFKAGIKMFSFEVGISPA